VVADARGDLPAARPEGERMAARLQSLGFAPVDTLVDRAASVDAVLAALGRVDHLHYAGHGQFAGAEGWESNLPVADGRRIGVADLLSQAALPARVVLSGCEMARADGQGSVSGLGLAQAFVLGGADEVVAATRPVRDADAAVVMDALYARLLPGAGAALALALARAQADLEASGARVDWAAFRVVVP
jgi:CHAT domain-containing protein